MFFVTYNFLINHLQEKKDKKGMEKYKKRTSMKTFAEVFCSKNHHCTMTVMILRAKNFCKSLH